MEEMTITPIWSDIDRELHFVALKQDISERQLRESEFRQSQKMEALGCLAGGIAHDFNNLLNVIGGYAGLLNLVERDDLTLSQISEEISGAVTSAAALTTQLLAFSRKQLLQTTVLSLNRVVSETATLLRRVVGEDVIVNLNLEPNLGCVLADAGQLQQVIMNIVVNARDAMPKGGSLTITTSNADVDCDDTAIDTAPRKGRYVKLSVCDTGIGMDLETRQRAFEPFFTTKIQGRGTGLGLATVYGIVRQSGGYVSLSSELGIGTTAEVYLKRVDEKPKVDIVRPPRGMQKHNDETILLVEDCLPLRRVIQRGLERAGYRVISSGDGAKGLRFSSSYRGAIHLLLTDIVMPGMDGAELAERVSVRRPDMRVLYMSGYTSEVLDKHERISASGTMIAKPFEMPALLAKMREALDSGHVSEGNASPAA